MSCNDFGQPELERSAAAPSRAAWWIAWAVALIVHGFAGLVLLGMLGALAPKFTELFVRLERQQGGLPWLTALVMFLSRNAVWLLAVGGVVDVAAFYVLARMPRRSWRLFWMWFSLVLIALAALDALTIRGLLLPVERMPTEL